MFLELRKLHGNGAIRGYQLGGKWLQTKDDEIIELYWKRDPKAIEETQTHYGEKLGRLSFGILENREDAQECVNDTYLRTWNSIPPTRPQFFFAYLAKICRFLCFDVLDHKNAQKRSALVVELTHEMQQCIPDSRNEDKVQGEQIGQNITAFLRTVKAGQTFIYETLLVWCEHKRSGAADADK